MTTRCDYLIVGGGSAGCVLANRLSADGRHRVLLLEAGPPDTNPFIRLPLGILPLVRGWFCNWSFWSQPQRHLAGRRLYQPRGRTLGGSSAINATVVTRGHPSDYDRWAELGCEGWSYREVLPWFIASECFEAEPAARDAAFHGRTGPLHVATRRSTNPVSQAFLEAAVQAGHRANPDFNGAEQDGVGPFHLFQKNGERCSNADAYLHPVRQRRNLEVVTGAQVTRVLLQGGRAVGVQARVGGQEQRFDAAREVILCAGAFQSPQLLMLSGIGPREELARHGIAVQHELPGVGENLQDHLDVFVETRARTRDPISFHPSAWLRLLRSWLRYRRERQGEFTSNAAEVGGFYRSSPDEPVPDIQWHFIPTYNARHGFDLWSTVKGYGYCVMNYDLRPLSRGRVGLHSADPLAPPRIDPNYAAEPRDVERLVRAIRQTRQVLSQPALAPYRGEEIAPGPAVQSDDELRDYVRRTAEIAYHPVGTCRMGRADDPLAVVDPRLRVRGLAGLRVVDASIMPTLPGCNTNAPVTMVAEKAAAMILDEVQADATPRASAPPRPQPVAA